MAGSSASEEKETEFWKANIPVCIAEMGLMMYNFGHDAEAFEHSFAQSAKSMVKAVAIYPDKRTIFIGEDPRVLETAMVDYTNNQKNKYADAFFQRWIETKHMIYQHHFIGNENKSLFSLIGIWVVDRWQYLEIKPKGTIHIKVGET